MKALSNNNCKQELKLLIKVNLINQTIKTNKSTMFVYVLINTLHEN